VDSESIVQNSAVTQEPTTKVQRATEELQRMALSNITNPTDKDADGDFYRPRTTSEAHYSTAVQGRGGVRRGSPAFIVGARRRVAGGGAGQGRAQGRDCAARRPDTGERAT
jgi:hypothetical protein